MTDSASALGLLSHLYCKICVAMGDVWENPIYLRKLLVHIEVPASSINGISFPVLLGGPSSKVFSRKVLPTTG